MKPTRVVFACDNHGEEGDPAALKRVLSFVKSYKPTIRIHGGDAFNFNWLRTSANKDEQEAHITDDVEAGIAFLSQFKPSHFLWGNHDHRLMRKLDNTNVGAMLALCHLILERINNTLTDCIQVGPYGKRRLLQIADWKFGHGWGSGINAVRDHALRYGNICIGHLHRVERVQAARYDQSIGLCAGCLCKLDMDYNAAQLNTLAQSKGFVFGEIRNGHLILQQEAF